MAKTGFFLDAKVFNAKFKQLTDKTIPSSADEGLKDAAIRLLKDAKDKPPQAPWLKGELHGSGIIEKGKEKHSIRIGFNKEYATRQHEVPPGTFHYTRTNVKQPGPKFLESKMIRYKEIYMKIIAEAIKRKGK